METKKKTIPSLIVLVAVIALFVIPFPKAKSLKRVTRNEIDIAFSEVKDARLGIVNQEMLALKRSSL